MPFNDRNHQSRRAPALWPLACRLVGSQTRNPTRVWPPPDSPSRRARQPGWFSRRRGGKVTTLLPACSSHNRSVVRHSNPGPAAPALPTHESSLCSHHVCVARGKPIPGRTKLADKPTNRTHNLTPQHVLSTLSKETHTQVLGRPKTRVAI